MQNHPIKKSRATPLAYFITMRAYGTWLHGDPRGSVNRIRNEYGKPGIRPRENLYQAMKLSMNYPPMHFDLEKRCCIQSTIISCCEKKNWKLHAIHVRTNHVHIIVESDLAPEIIMRKFKTNTTTEFRKQKLTNALQPVWARDGSTKYLWTDVSLHYACQYTIFEQGEKMTYFQR